MTARRRASGPLTGVRVVVTRAEESDGPLSRRLAERGARVLHWPAVAFEPPEDPADLERALARLDDYDWIVFTSPRAVAALREATDPPVGRPRVAAVGGSTAERLRRAGWRVDLEAVSAGADGLVRAFEEVGCAGAEILFPASSIARDSLPRGLRRLGATVDRITAYRTVPAPLDRRRCLAELEGEDPPIVTLASPSALGGLEGSLGSDGLARLLAVCPVVVIGETTARAVTAIGFSPVRIAHPTTLAGLADAVEQVAQEVRVG